ncbi:sec-independent protein translocase protein TatB [Yoonia tamlensis]|uniref:Sec-independent protein translocase protein TatB n=1 Tax=Yoonia tamlensis TaxID=390270 RepID=A0A1I6G349_9RHOB|nr:Sec-independent protein translocase protein TatB [Yoonia tamlensis]SFR36624.1 sec-independent protein translocase protein TatB [Yoonia tamlensis]
MFGLGWSEMVLVGIVALIVIGPKDLPGMFRTLGQFTGKARGMAREFSRAMEAAADEAGVNEIQKTVRAAANPQKFGVDKIKEATGMTQAPEKPALSPERQAMKEKMSEAMGKAATERQTREAEAAAQAAQTPESESK